jgi:hypothetical protein
MPVPVVVWFWTKAVRSGVGDGSVLVLVGGCRTGAAHLVNWMPKPPNVMVLYTGEGTLDEVTAANTCAARDLLPEELEEHMLDAAVEGIADGVPTWTHEHNAALLKRRELELETVRARAEMSSHKEEQRTQLSQKRAERAAAPVGGPAKRQKKAPIDPAPVVASSSQPSQVSPKPERKASPKVPPKPKTKSTGLPKPREDPRGPVPGSEHGGKKHWPPPAPPAAEDEDSDSTPYIGEESETAESGATLTSDSEAEERQRRQKAGKRAAGHSGGKSRPGEVRGKKETMVGWGSGADDQPLMPFRGTSGAGSSRRAPSTGRSGGGAAGIMERLGDVPGSAGSGKPRR